MQGHYAKGKMQDFKLPALSILLNGSKMHSFCDVLLINRGTIGTLLQTRITVNSLRQGPTDSICIHSQIPAT